jgi:two-component system copper resistance phosphate regulon response regulator CusR
MSRILIAEDEQRIASFIERGLKASGYATRVVGDGDTALALARTGGFDLLILDLGLPGQDGLNVLHALRDAGTEIPVVILTARSSVKEVVTGFEGGADDYVTKPFSFEELLVRVRARLRPDRQPEPTVLRAGDAELDLRTRSATIEGKHVALSAREFALAQAFFEHPGQVLSREQLLSRVWGYDFDPGSNVVDVYVGYLRKKLGKDRIVNVRGMGYMLDAEPGTRRRQAPALAEPRGGRSEASSQGSVFVLASPAARPEAVRSRPGRPLRASPRSAARPSPPSAPIGRSRRRSRSA